jgi:hypothetical protein
MGLTIEGILFIVLAWSCIIILTAYCFFKVLKSERKKG